MVVRGSVLYPYVLWVSGGACEREGERKRERDGSLAVCGTVASPFARYLWGWGQCTSTCAATPSSTPPLVRIGLFSAECAR